MQKWERPAIEEGSHLGQAVPLAQLATSPRKTQFCTLQPGTEPLTAQRVRPQPHTCPTRAHTLKTQKWMGLVQELDRAPTTLSPPQPPFLTGPCSSQGLPSHRPENHGGSGLSHKSFLAAPPPMAASWGQRTCICASGDSAAGPCCCGSRDRHNPGDTVVEASCMALSYSSPGHKQFLHRRPEGRG